MTKMGFCCKILSLNDLTPSPISRPGTHCLQWQRANAWANTWDSWLLSFCIAREVGGYMGILIGASVLTFCEVLDLLIYNFLMKCVDYVYRRHAVNMHSKSPPEEKSI